MSETTETTPTVSDYVNASYWAYAQAGTPYPDRDTTLPTGFSYFTVGGQTLIDYDPAVGLYAAAVVNATGQVIVTFEGTNLYTGNDTFTAAQLFDDYDIAEGVNAPSYQPALAFTQTVLADAEAAGYSAQDVFLSGHSLGAAEAEYVATQTGLSGTTFGTPGIPSADIPTTTTSQFTDYVERGDPVGNYAVGWNDFDLLQTQNVEHFGTAISLGSYESAGLLFAANVTYAAALQAPTKVEELAGIVATVALLDKAAVEYHALLTYAADLGVTVSGASGTADGADGGAALAAALFGTIPGVTVNADGSLDVAGASLSATGAVSVSGGSLTLTVDGQSATLSLPATGTGLSLQSDGAGGTDVTLGTTADGYVLGGSEAVTIQGDSAPLTFVGGAGSVSVLGGSGAVTLYGATASTATTFLEGGSGSSVITGGAGATTLVAGTAASTLIGGTGPTLMLARGAGADEIVAGSGATSVNGTYGSGPEQIFAGSGADFVALGAGADTMIAGSGVASVSGGAGPDVYGFIDGHAGGSEIISGLKPTDILAFGGYNGDPITSEGVFAGSDLITLKDGTVILVLGVDHKIFS
jgi:Ca2+-binding RTX toxin-like protein